MILDRDELHSLRVAVRVLVEQPDFGAANDYRRQTGDDDLSQLAALYRALLRADKVELTEEVEPIAVNLTNVVTDEAIEVHGVDGPVRGTNVVASKGITITDVRNVR